MKIEKMKEKINNLMSDPDFLQELELASKEAEETCNYLIEASKIEWEDLHRPMTV